MRSDATDVNEVVLVRLGQVTHGSQSDQRAVNVPFTRAGQNLKAQMPPKEVVPPGFYYLFVNARGDGGVTPSVAEIVQVPAL